MTGFRSPRNKAANKRNEITKTNASLNANMSRNLEINKHTNKDTFSETSQGPVGDILAPDYPRTGSGIATGR